MTRKKVKKSKWYDSKTLFSYNCLFNLVMSGRGMGKTFHFKCKSIDLFLETGKHTLWIRRYKSEMKFLALFFDDVKKIYSDLDFKIKGDYGLINGKIAFIFCSLSTAQNIKGNSLAYVYLIVFDEYCIIESANSRYLTNEITLLFGLYETTCRDREGVPLILLSNSISYVNPFMIHFSITPNGTKNFYRSPYCDEVVLQVYENKAFVTDKKETRFSKIIDGSEYASYSIENNVMCDDSEFILEKKPKGLQFLCGFIYSNINVGVWRNDDGLYYVQDKLNNGKIYTVLESDAKENLKRIQLFRSSQMCKFLKNSYYKNNLRFSNQNIKKTWSKIIKFL